jgi:hypothetical protein
MFDQQQLNLSRCRESIGPAVLDFAAFRLSSGQPRFFAEALRAWVSKRHPGAPGSADRVLRDLRARGALDYRVVNRSQSLYEVVSVREQVAA